MSSEFELINKYNIIYIDNQRYYFEDLSIKNFHLEHCTPYSLEIGDQCYVVSSWKSLLIEVCTELLKKFPEKRDELLDFRYPWNLNIGPFESEARKQTDRIGEGIYLYNNNTALHACWLLREVLQIFDIDFRNTKFIIHRPPGGEPEECRKFFITKTKNNFIKYYTEYLGNPIEKAEMVLRNIDKLNVIQSKLSKAYDNFYLFASNPGSFSNYKSRLLKYLKTVMMWQEKNLKLADRFLRILYDFAKSSSL